MGFFDGLSEEKYDRTYGDGVLIRRIVDYFKPQSKRLAGVTVYVTLMSATGALLPIAVSKGVDLLKDKTGWTALYMGGVVLILGVLLWVFNLFRRQLMVRAIADVVLDLRTRAFTAAAGHDLSFYDEFSSGKVVSRITSDTRDIGQLVELVTDLISQFLESVILAVVLLVISWKLTLIIFATTPLLFVIGLLYRRMARNVTQRGMRAMANVNSTIKETVSGIAIAKNFRQEQTIYHIFEDANTTSYGVNVRRGFVLAIVFPTINALYGVIFGGMVYLGGMTAANAITGITVGSWYLFLQSQDRFLFPIMNLSSFWTNIQNGLSAAERVFALIDAEPNVRQLADEEVASLDGKVEFDHVSFRYKTGEPVLDDFSLEIEPGENVAIVGHTGAGKSSIAKLIARFYEFQDGKILIDGKDIRLFNLPSYRRQLGIVSQMPFLFAGSVLENIRYAAPNSTVEEVNALARQIGNGEWLDTLPNGLETEVGERGAFISMGQRQLVALMRVLVQKPAIFILDEATASVDPFTEWQIQQALNLILSKSTSILIAHRLSTVRSADRIVVIEKGRIIEIGNHVDLLEKGGHYATLYNTYFRHQSLAYVEQSRQVFQTE
jgi:ATP-binding cassette subfamily B protein